MRNKFCSHCGTKHVSENYPKECLDCKVITWVNPTPVAVLLQPVTDGLNTGILIGKRSIEPQAGLWNLIGGYIDPEDEDVIAAAVRELSEETGLTATSDGMELFWSLSDKTHLLIFVKAQNHFMIDDLSKFVHNSECSEIRVAWEPETLCFHSHTKALEMWFEENDQFHRTDQY